LDSHEALSQLANKRDFPRALREAFSPLSVEDRGGELITFTQSPELWPTPVEHVKLLVADASLQTGTSLKELWG